MTMQTTTPAVRTAWRIHRRLMAQNRFGATVALTMLAAAQLHDDNARQGSAAQTFTGAELAAVTGWSRSTTAGHLRTLERLGIVRASLLRAYGWTWRGEGST